MVDTPLTGVFGATASVAYHNLFVYIFTSRCDTLGIRNTLFSTSCVVDTINVIYKPSGPQ